MNPKHAHKEQLGYEVPEGYFESSKKDMLHFLNTEEKKTSAFLAQRPYSPLLYLALWHLCSY